MALDFDQQCNVPRGSSDTGTAHAGPVSAQILVVEDDEALSRFLHRILCAENFGVIQAFSGAEALEKLCAKTELLILDLNLPGLDGLAVLRSLRPRFPRLPVLVLTARSRVESTVLALESGADDCLTKPFSYVELLARVRALLRRNETKPLRSSQCGDLHVDREAMRVVRDNLRIDLTPREYHLLEFLLRTPGVPVSRATLRREIWGGDLDPSTNIVDVYMKYVRDKIDFPGKTKLIRTVRGVGYVIADD